MISSTSKTINNAIYRKMGIVAIAFCCCVAVPASAFVPTVTGNDIAVFERRLQLQTMKHTAKTNKRNKNLLNIPGRKIVHQTKLSKEKQMNPDENNQLKSNKLMQPRQSKNEVAKSKSTNNDAIGRRRWIRDAIMSSVAVTSVASKALESATKTENSPAVCDPTIESYRKGTKQIHIVGTAHVSSVSAQLSGAVVKEMKPGAVFIELDPQRLVRAFRNGKIHRPTTVVFFTGGDPEGDRKVTAQSATLLPQDLERKGLFQFLEKMTVKNPIQEMYEELESQGITPGEEFITAVEEGAKIGSIIILGDRRMDITIRRLAKALLLRTYPQKLLEADRIITSKMKDHMPEIKEWEAELKRDGKKTRELSSEEFSMVVERMKTKETTMEFMKEIKKAAPELYDALVGERDVFMGRAMDTLLSAPLSSIVPLSARGSQSMERMVAVVGLGHMNGIGKELTSLGWSRFVPPQC